MMMERFMKLNTIDKVLASLEEEKYEIILDEDLMDEARKPIIKMLDLSKKLGII